MKRADRWLTKTAAGASVLAASVLLLSGCGKPHQATTGQAAGSWCSSDDDRLTLDADGTFAITHLSLRFAEILLPAEGYVDDYRIHRDYGGEVPTEASGTWTIESDANDPSEYHSAGVILQLEKVGIRTENDAPMLYFDGGEESWGFAVEHGATFWRYFDRCDDTDVTSSPPASTPTGWPQ